MLNYPTVLLLTTNHFKNIYLNIIRHNFEKKNSISGHSNISNMMSKNKIPEYLPLTNMVKKINVGSDNIK